MFRSVRREQEPVAHEASQYRHHRPCRPRQDDPRRPAPAAVGRVSREPARRRAGDGFERPRTRARHHHSRQGDLGGVEGRSGQYRRYARPRRFRRRGRTHLIDGRWRDRAGRRRRGADAADQVRGRQGAEDRPETYRLRQQGRQGRRASERGGQRGVRSLRRARRDRRAARLSDSLWFGQAGLDGALARRVQGQHGAAVRPGLEACRAAEGRRRRFPDAGHAARGQSLSRAHHHRPRLFRLDPHQRPGQGAGPSWGPGGARPGDENPRLPRDRARPDRRSDRGRHRRHCGAREVQRRRHARAARKKSSRCTPSRSTRRLSR